MSNPRDKRGFVEKILDKLGEKAEKEHQEEKKREQREPRTFKKQPPTGLGKFKTGLKTRGTDKEQQDALKKRAKIELDQKLDEVRTELQRGLQETRDRLRAEARAKASTKEGKQQESRSKEAKSEREVLAQDPRAVAQFPVPPKVKTQPGSQRVVKVLQSPNKSIVQPGKEPEKELPKDQVKQTAKFRLGGKG